MSIMRVRGRGRTCAEPAATRIGGGGRLATSSVASRRASSQVEGTTGFILVLRTLRASLCSMVLRSSSALHAFRTLVTALGTAVRVSSAFANIDARIEQVGVLVARLKRLGSRAYWL